LSLLTKKHTMVVSADKILGSILKHDAKLTSYKIALVRALNDVVLSFPTLAVSELDVAVPLQELARFWIAYYWPLMDANKPILQGPRAFRDGHFRSDLIFRPALSRLRMIYESQFGLARPADGFMLIQEMRVPRRAERNSAELRDAYAEAVSATAEAIKMPIRYAGPGDWSVFARPKRLRDMSGVVPIPRTTLDDICVCISPPVWQTLLELSMWVEALCIHEWCLFTQGVVQEHETRADRGDIYRLLTDRPDNRRPLTWERNQIDLLIMEGHVFTCPWTHREVSVPGKYDLDHLIPLAVYPTNELWNLVPADPKFNTNVKGARLPSDKRLERAFDSLVQTYEQYNVSPALARQLKDDLSARFPGFGDSYSGHITATAVVGFVKSIAEARNIAIF
jgi:hypothetical protein